MLPLKVDHGKYGASPRVISQLRRLAHQGRRVTIAVNTALLTAVEETVYLTRNSWLTVPGKIFNVMWQYMCFENTKFSFLTEG